MKTLTYRKAMSLARRYIRTIKAIPEGEPVPSEMNMMALHWKQQAVKLAHSDAERDRAQAL